MKYVLLSIAALASVSCGTDLTVKFGKNGLEILPPSEPIVIPYERSSK
jgi:hypothetical protein